MFGRYRHTNYCALQRATHNESPDIVGQSADHGVDRDQDEGGNSHMPTV
jgi:hypothetical protein